MRLLQRLVPHPILTILLTLVWLLLVNHVTLNSLVFGGFLGIVIPFITQPYWPARPRLRNPGMILQYFGIVIYDIIAANIVVAKLILFKRNSQLSPAWVCVPLELRTPEAITVLASTITLTPGTVSADLSDHGHSLLVHCLDAPDPGAIRDEIKERYERRLMEIFE